MRRKDRPEPPTPLAADTVERLTAIVEAAEHAAVTVIDDAEKQARRQLDDARQQADRLVGDRLAALSDLTDSLISQAEAIGRQSEQLIASLEEAKRRLATGEAPAAGDRGRTGERPAHLTAVTAVAEAPADTPSGDGEQKTPAGARLLATQMAVSGSSRDEIEARLRNGFDIVDTASILDAILGPEEV
jgi:vacuolar-type H+-ATPase subunit H